MKRQFGSVLGVIVCGLFLMGQVPRVHAQEESTGCSLSTLKGDYAVQGQGRVVGQLPGFPAPPLPFAEVAIDHLDGAGNATGKFTVNLQGSLLTGSVAGTYTLGPDCIGLLSLQTSIGLPVREYFVVVRGGGLRLVDIDPYVVVTRTMEKVGD